MLKLIQSSRSVVLLRDCSNFSRVSSNSLWDSAERLPRCRHIVNSPILFSVTTNPFCVVLDELMRGKWESKKIKKKTVNNVAKKTKVSPSVFKHFHSVNKFTIPTMSLTGDASCSAVSQKFKRTLTTDSTDSDDDVIILDSPNRDDVQVLFDSQQQNFQRQHFLKSHPSDQHYYFSRDEEFPPLPPKILSAAEIEEAAKEGKEKYEEIRAERFTEYGKQMQRKGDPSKPDEKGFIFRVLSWNILSQKLMEQHRYLYANTHNASLDWEYRKKLILAEIKDSHADILTLQEVEEESFHRLSELKELGYEGIFKKRTHDKIDGCAMYYRPDVLRLKEHSFVEFYQPGVRLLDRDNIGIVARFERKGFEGTEFVVATTHLLYNPRRHDIKLVQMQLLLAEVERLAFSGAMRQEDKLIPTYHPCIVTGDLNLKPQTGVYNLITEGELQYDRLSSKNLSSLDSPNNYSLLDKVLLPSYLGITNNCQHDKVVSQRTFMRQPAEEENRLLLLYNSERKNNRIRNSEEMNRRDEDPRNANVTDSLNKYGTGVLTHNLKFKSVYTHLKDDEPEATTHQGHWLTVDYIFYSPVSKKNEESSLRLVSYKGLPSADEANNELRTIPNLFCGSDHLPLVSSFFLATS